MRSCKKIAIHAEWSFMSVIVSRSKLRLFSEKKPQITQDLDSSFKCTGCNVSKITFINRIPVLGYRGYGY